MKRLLRIAVNSAVFSFIPILSWFCLGLLVDKNLANVFTLTYPLQFIWALLKSIFGTGANIIFCIRKILISSVFVMLIISDKFYELDLRITLILERDV